MQGVLRTNYDRPTSAALITGRQRRQGRRSIYRDPKLCCGKSVVSHNTTLLLCCDKSQHNTTYCCVASCQHNNMLCCGKCVFHNTTYCCVVTAFICRLALVGHRRFGLSLWSQLSAKVNVTLWRLSNRKLALLIYLKKILTVSYTVSSETTHIGGQLATGLLYCTACRLELWDSDAIFIS